MIYALLLFIEFAAGTVAGYAFCRTQLRTPMRYGLDLTCTGCSLTLHATVADGVDNPRDRACLGSASTTLAIVRAWDQIHTAHQEDK